MQMQRRLPRQPSSYDLEGLLLAASACDAWYQQVAGSWAVHLGIEHRAAPLKKRGRAFEKMDRSYGGDCSRLLDLTRSSLVVSTISEARITFEFVISQVLLLQVKNRYDPSYSGHATAGYRDLNLQITFPEMAGTPFAGFIVELQIILAEYLEIKSAEGHRRYVVCRNLRGD